MGIFNDVFETAVDVYFGGVIGTAINESKDMAQGHDSTGEVLGGTVNRAANAKTTNIAGKSSEAAQSAGTDAVTTAESTAIQQNKTAQTAVNTGYDVAQFAVGGANAVGAFAPTAAGATAAETAAPTSTAAVAPGETMIDETARPAGEVIINETAGNTKPILKTTAQKVVTGTGKAIQGAGKVYTAGQKTYDTFQRDTDIPEVVGVAPGGGGSKPMAGSMSPALIGGGQFDTVFGSASQDMLAPSSLIGARPKTKKELVVEDFAPPPTPDPIATPTIDASPFTQSVSKGNGYGTPFQSANTYAVSPYQTPGPVASDRELKTNIQSADRSIQNFLSQLGKP